MSDQANTALSTGEKKQKRKKTVGREILEWVLTLGMALVLALLIRSYIFEPVRVDGNSMLNTLKDGEYMIATKFDYLSSDSPKRFDIAIVHYPGRGSTNFVKRIVGLPGETLELRHGELYINGEPVPQNFDHTPSISSFGPVTVPQGAYFVMGDNRDNSNDSRAVGPLTRDMIKGHVQYVAFPFDRMRVIETPGE